MEPIKDNHYYSIPQTFSGRNRIYLEKPFSALAAGAARLMAALLFGVSVVDPATYAAVALGLASVALFANYIPALRATRVNPVEALRYE